MLVTDSFVFVHIPKTAGSFIQTVIRDHLPVIDHNAILRAHLPPDHRIWTHTPYSDLPERWRSLPAFCIVRNPWDWYVSWYHYSIQRRPGRPRRDPRKRAVWESAFDEGRADFSEVVRRACHGEIDDPLAQLMRAEQIDLYSAHVRTIAGTGLDQPNFTVVRFERLRHGVLRFLRERRVLTPELRAAIRREPPVKASSHGPYADYYSPDLAQTVGEKARWLCERFDYSFH